MFFDRPVAAYVARNLASAVLTQALDRRHQIGLDSYDRLFPSQDTLPRGGFGNLIALPLQRQSRERGNTVFLDHDLEPYPDQWRFLASLPKLDPSEAEAIVKRAARAGRLLAVDHWIDAEDESEPWTVSPLRRRSEAPIPGPLRASVSIVLANQLFVAMKDLPPVLINRLRRLAAFQNPEFYRAERMRLSTFGKPRLIDCSEAFPDHLALPRKCLPELLQLARANGVQILADDQRRPGTPITVAFNGQLTDQQQAAADALMEHDVGVLSAPTAFGKTVIAAWLIAQRSVNTLVVVHPQHLLEQWRERLLAFLNLAPKAIGQVGAGKRRPSGTIDVALLQSLNRGGEVRDLVATYGQVIVDECHHIPAFGFEKVMREVHARFVVGLTATPVRKDGHHPIIAMQCGPIRCNVPAKEQAALRPFAHEVIVRQTDFKLPSDVQDAGIQDLYSRLAADDPRTSLMVKDVLAAVQAGRSPLVLTERTDHLEKLAAAIEAHGAKTVVFRGGLGVRERRKRLELFRAIADGQPKVLIATGRYIGEGFDEARLDTLFLTLPVSWRGTVQQYAGRLHRLHPGKQTVQIFDYVDSNLPMLLRMHEKRLKGYRAIGYSVIDSYQSTSAV